VITGRRFPPFGWRPKEYIILGAFVVAVAWVVIAVSGCTIAPKPVEAHAASPVGNDSNGGIVGKLPTGSWEVTPGAIVKYNALIGAGYGKAFLPPLKANDGVAALPDGPYLVEVKKGVFQTLPSTGNFTLDAEHAADWARMATQFRSGQKP
jgi:hypothetical protein